MSSMNCDILACSPALIGATHWRLSRQEAICDCPDDADPGDSRAAPIGQQPAGTATPMGAIRTFSGVSPTLMGAIRTFSVLPLEGQFRGQWSRVVYTGSGGDPVFPDSVDKLDSSNDVGEQLVAA